MPETPRRRPAATHREKAEKALRGWKAWSLIAAIGFLGGLLLWMGQAIVVRCERIDSRIDATIQRRLFGILPLSSETVRDVVKADVYIVWNRSGTGGKQTRGATEALELMPRDGTPVRRTRFGPSVGTQPFEMSEQIQAFITGAGASLTTWWMPWLVNVAAIPFLLIFGGITGEILLRALGLLQPATVASK